MAPSSTKLPRAVLMRQHPVLIWINALGEHKNPGLASSPTELKKPFGSLIRGDTNRASMPGPETFCVYQFKVVLRGISPMIWRRLLLRNDHSIADLHYTIQIAMGWSDSHLHRFHIHRRTSK